MRALVAGLFVMIVVVSGVPAHSAPAEPLSPPPTEAPPTGGLRIRKDVQDLNPQERRDYVDAVWALKRHCSPYAAGARYAPLPEGYAGCITPDGEVDPDGLSWYDHFVLWHRELSRCDPTSPYNMNGHNGPLFLPWHRQYLLLFEDALREVSGKNITVPYWDTTDERSTDETFADDFMGGNGSPDDGWAVLTGPFAADRWNDFPIRNEGVFWGPSSTGHITRNMGSLTFASASASHPAAPNPASEVEAAFSVNNYDASPYDDSSDERDSFRNSLEGWVGDHKRPPYNPIDQGPSRAYCTPDGWSVVPMRRNMTHNKAHTYVGGVIGSSPDGAKAFGTMAAVPTSPNDPVFFLLHANVDRLWALWQETRGSESGSAGGFPTDSKNPWDDPDAPMQPFVQDGVSVAPVDVWDTNRLGYRYAHPRWTLGNGSDGERWAALAGRGTTYFCRIQPEALAALRAGAPGKRG